jgi:hypothetical protein
MHLHLSTYLWLTKTTRHPCSYPAIPNGLVSRAYTCVRVITLAEKDAIKKRGQFCGRTHEAWQSVYVIEFARRRGAMRWGHQFRPFVR